MDHMLQGLEKKGYWYMDDILVFGHGPGDLRRKEKAIRDRITSTGNHPNEDKCETMKEEILFAGLTIRASGVGPNSRKLQEILSLPVPGTKKEKQSALGLVSYLRDFIPLASHFTAELTCSKENLLTPHEYEKAWGRLTRHIAAASTDLCHWRDEEDADLYTDASGQALGAILIQDGRICSVASKKLQGAQTRYSATDREHLSLVFAAEKFRIFLHRSRGVTRVWNDHAALICRKSDRMTPRQARWHATIGQWMPRLQHVKGQQNPADYLSRWSVRDGGPEISIK